MNSALTKFLQLAAEAGLLTTIASEHLDSQFNYYEDPRDMAERCETVPEQASEDQLQDPNSRDCIRKSLGRLSSERISDYDSIIN